MNKNEEPSKGLEKSLKKIQEVGIQADTAHIKKDMCAQFSDEDEWIREYVVNSFDAHAKNCKIWAEGIDGQVTVFVKDDGHGMDKQGITDFCTLYRSRKKYSSGKTVGQFGIGKMSVAAIKGQKKFKVRTSNGHECWIAEAGNLLSDEPVKIYRIKQVPPQGTLFEITFETKDTPEQVMRRLTKILRKYTRYLPIRTELNYPDDPETGLSAITETIGQEWSAENEWHGMAYEFNLLGKQFEVMMSTGRAANEIYQNKVLVSDGYDLLSYDLNKKIQVPHLRIQVNSAAFELPFGRHCLRNEYILKPIAAKLREEILPDYFNYLLHLYTSQPEESDSLENTLTDMAGALVVQIPDHRKKWCNIPLFRIYPDKRVSLVRLDHLITEAGKVYLEENENTGADYSFFDAPILLQDQPGNSLNFLKDCFSKELINLSLNDVVIEMPANSGLQLSKDEEDFAASLGFASDLSNMQNSGGRSEGFDNEYGLGESDGFGFFGGRKSDFNTNSTKKNDASALFKNLSWRVNYLVGRDGKTPCMTHRFIFNQNTVVLNLYHPDVQQLVKLSKTAPKLIGHWAVAMCFTEDNRILSFMSSESRETLLLVDAMMKMGTGAEPKDKTENKNLKKVRKSMRNLLRGSGFDFGIN
jgi:hypothetical protein